MIGNLPNSPATFEVAGGLKNYGLVTNVNADNLISTGFYHLGSGCTPQFQFIIVFKIGGSILQIKTTDGGSELSTRVFVGGKWLKWYEYVQR